MFFSGCHENGVKSTLNKVAGLLITKDGSEFIHQLVRLLHFAFPYYDNLPAELLQLQTYLKIALHILLKLALPERLI